MTRIERLYESLMEFVFVWLCKNCYEINSQGAHCCVCGSKKRFLDWFF